MKQGAVLSGKKVETILDAARTLMQIVRNDIYTVLYMRSIIEGWSLLPFGCMPQWYRVVVSYTNLTEEGIGF